MSNNEIIITKNLEEVSKIHSNPKYMNWRYEYIDGEYRFYSPNYRKQQVNDKLNKNEIETVSNIDRITSTINRVAPSVSPIGRNDPTALSTKEGFVYRETGISQIYDIIDCGYVRSNEKRKSNQVWWTSGGENSFHVNKRPVLVASSDIVKDDKIGAVSIGDLSEIWFYDEKIAKWNNKIEDIKKAFIEKQQGKTIENNPVLELEQSEISKTR